MSSNADSIQLEGTREQTLELQRAVSGFKIILFSLGGENKPMDAVLENRISRLNYWEQAIELRLSNHD